MPPRCIPPWLAPPIGLVVLLAVGTALRLWHLGGQSFWIDELFSWHVAQPGNSLGTLWELVLSDVHPPLYYLLLHGWFLLVGDSIVAARLPSAVCGVLTVAAAIGLYRPLLARGRHLAFVLLITLSYGGIYYAQEARPYALLLFLAVVMTAAALRLAELRAGTDERAWNRTLVLLTGASLVAAYTHYFGVVLAASAFGATFLSSAAHGRRAAKVVGAGLIVGVGFAPWLALHLSRVADKTGGHFWIGQGSQWYRWNLVWFAKLGFGQPASLTVLVLGAAVALRRRHCDAGVWLPALTCVIGAAFLALVEASTPVVTGRNLLVFLPALYLVAAAIVAAVAEALRHWSGALGGLAYALLLAVVFTEPLPWYFTAVHKSQWRESAADVLDDPRCREGAVFVYDEAFSYSYFVKRAGSHLRLVEIPRGEAEQARDRRAGGDGCPVILWAANVDRDELEEILATMGIGTDTVDIAAFHEAFVVREKRTW